MNSMRAAIRHSALAPAELTTDSGEQSFCFAEAFLGFDGHFPGYPILPAILQTLMAQLLVEQVVGDKLQLQTLQRAKFTRQLRPGERIDVTVNCVDKDDRLHCSTRLSVGDESAATFKMIFASSLSDNQG